MSEAVVEPCPFCGGKAYPSFNQHIMLSFTVLCSKCKATGPHVKIDFERQRRVPWEEYTQPYREEAISSWNKYRELQNPEPVELQEEQLDDLAAASGC